MPDGPAEQIGGDIAWVCRRGHMVDFRRSSCARCRGEFGKTDLGRRRPRRLRSLLALGAAGLLIATIAAAIAGLGSGSVTSGISSADTTTTIPTTTTTWATPAQASRAAAYDDGRGYGQSLKDDGNVPQAVACAYVPGDWPTDQQPAWLLGCHDSYSTR